MSPPSVTKLKQITTKTLALSWHPV